MAKKTGAGGETSGKRKTLGKRKTGGKASRTPAQGVLVELADPPSYEALVGELSALQSSLTSIVQAGRDSSGPLSAVELELARVAIREIQAAEQVFICIQGYSPYRRGL